MEKKPFSPVEHVIRSRRTIKKFKQDAISIETLQEILETAVWAPNHKMREPWRFIAFVDEGKQQLINALKEEKLQGRMPRPMKPEKEAQLMAVPAFVAVVMNVDPRPVIFEEDYAAVAALIQNFQLAAWEKGIGTLWSTDQSIYAPFFHEAIGVERGEKVVAILHVGYPEVTPKPRERTALANKLTIVSTCEA